MRVRVGATVIVALITGGHVGAYADDTPVRNGCVDGEHHECAGKLAEMVIKNDTGVRTEARMVQSEPGQRLVVKW